MDGRTFYDDNRPRTV